MERHQCAGDDPPIPSVCCGGSNGNGRHARVEVLHLTPGGYELRLFDADGTEHVEQFTDAADLTKRQQAIHDQLIAQGWSRSCEWLL